DDLSGILNLPTNPMVQIYNNTFYIKEGVSFIRDGMTGGTAAIENNIIYNAGELKEEDWTKNSNVTYSHNLYFNYENTPESDEYAITENPQFVDAGSAPTSITGNDPTKGQSVTHDRDAFAGYKLEDSSPAINKGNYIPNNGGQDFFGNNVTGTPDIGAYESDVVSLDIYSDVYTIDGTEIKGIEKDVTVEEFLSNISYDDKLAVDVYDEDGTVMADHDMVEVGFSFKFSRGDSEKTYTVVGNDNSKLLDAQYMVDEENKEIFVPILDGNPTTVDEIKDGIEVHQTADIKVFDDGKEVDSGAIAEDMLLKVIAENGDENIYTIKAKNEYHYVFDFVNNQQGNVWYAQKKVDGKYSNLTTFSNQYPTWEGKSWAAVGLQGGLNDPVTEDTHGLLVDSMRKASHEQSHSMAYRVPKTGTIKLSFKDDEPFLRQASPEQPNTGGDVKLTFRLDDKPIGETYTLSNDGSPLEIDPMEIEVERGEYLRIEAINEGSPSVPSMSITPMIAYQDNVAEEDISAELILKKLAEYEDDFSTKGDYRSVEIHLTAITHFQNQEKGEKVIKHLNGLKNLINYQKENQLISEEAYNFLRDGADDLLKNWK